jgi:MFS family permease
MEQVAAPTTDSIAQARPGLIATLRSFPRPVWILCGGSFLNKFGTFVIPFLALYMTRRGFSPTEAGLAIGAYGIGNFLASILGGHLADTIGRRKTIVFSMVAAAASMLLLSQAETFWSIVFFTGLTGLSAEFYRPAASALLADLVPPGQRVTAYSIYRLAFNAGWAFGPATAGFLAAHSFFWLFVGDAATSLLFGWVAWAALPKGVRSDHTQVKWSEALKHALRDRRLLQVLAASLIIAPAFLQMSSTFGLQVTARGFSESAYGLLISLNGVLVVLFELPLSNLTQRFQPRRAMAVGFVLIGLGFAMNIFAATLAAFTCAILVFTLGEMITMPVTSAYIANLAPAHLRGRYMGTFGFAWALGLTFGPAAGMALFAVNPTWLWLACGVSGLLAAIVILRK